MDQRNNVVLQGSESFSRGELDNLNIAANALQLTETGGRHALYGCYTSHILLLPAFARAYISWNADTPKGTVTETQCRVLIGGDWSGWHTMGRWSPVYPRRYPEREADEYDPVAVNCDGITVTRGTGTAVQLRVYLYTENEKVTPSVRRLCASAVPLEWKPLPGRPVNRKLFLPAYDAASRTDRFGDTIDLPIVIASLVNRYGRDMLPEEIGFAMADRGTMRCGSAAYAAAIAGCGGFCCYQTWTDLAGLRSEIRSGCSVAVKLQTHEGKYVWMGLYGMGYDDEVHAEYVLLNDPFAAAGNTSHTAALADFEKRFTGHALVLKPENKGIPISFPRRRSVTLKSVEPALYRISFAGTPAPLPDGFSGWAAVSPKGGSEAVCATTAARRFLPVEIENGCVRLPAALYQPGAAYTVFIANEEGELETAELRLPANLKPLNPPPEPAAETPAAPPAETAAVPQASTNTEPERRENS